MKGERMSNSIVYRKDVVEALYQALRTQLQGTFTDSMSLAISMANALPPAEKTGKWIRTAGDYIGDDISGYYDYHWSCSECEREAITNDWNMYELSDYCPHCGVKMEGEER